MTMLRNVAHDYRYIIGIDLGTTNSAVAYVDLTAEIESPESAIRIFEIPQYVALGEVAKRPVLPSFLYLPGRYDLPREQLPGLPWDSEQTADIGIVGEFARQQGATVPHRLVASAKSWLCHAKVDRKAKILPWGTKEAEDLKKVSPVEASARYLEHIRNAWNFIMARGSRELAFEEQLIVLTVPASFDEVARELTVEAARLAGIPKLVLIEEPLAAFYGWLSTHSREWQEIIRPGQIVLICDVGGGTTDLTIVALKESLTSSSSSTTIEESGEGLKFDRLAVGDHLLLGGDNMDIAIARQAEEKLTGKIGSLDPRRWHQLCYQARKIKEEILNDPSISEVKFTVLGTGSRLIGDTLSASMEAERLRKLILDGFFPFVSIDEKPIASQRSGIVEWGLPYEQDPAITRHIAWFWKRFEKFTARETGREHPRPDFVLFNGGALTPVQLRSRILDVVENWFGERPRELIGPRLDLAVAVGAAYYGLVRLGAGVRVGAGSPRSYYIVVGKKDVPQEEGEGQRREYEALCIVPRGMEEGFEYKIEGQDFEIISNQPVSFQLLASTTRVEDRLGEIVTLSDEDAVLLPPIYTVLRFGKGEEGRTIPVSLGVRLTEVGTLEMWCQSLKTTHKWQLQFDVRETSESEREAGVREGRVVEETVDYDRIELALALIPEVFEHRKMEPSELVKAMVEVLAMPRERWPIGVVRKIADVLLEHEKGRAISLHHEARWFNLLGFCLRPGFGDVLDEWRMKRVWKLFPQDLVFSRNVQCRLEWWIFWRRVSGGLTAGQQWHIYQQVSALVQDGGGSGKKKKSRTFSPQESIELWMTLASFEHLPVDVKVKLGRVFLDKILKSGRPSPKELWVVGRIGARALLYGPADKVVPPEEVVGWVEELLKKSFPVDDAFGYTLLSLVRETGDRARDVPAEVRERTYEVVRKVLSEQKVRSFVERAGSCWGKQAQEWAFGETLPPGIVIRDRSCE